MVTTKDDSALAEESLSEKRSPGWMQVFRKIRGKELRMTTSLTETYLGYKSGLQSWTDMIYINLYSQALG